MGEFGRRDGGWADDLRGYTDSEQPGSEFAGDERVVPFGDDGYEGTAHPEVRYDDPQGQGAGDIARGDWQ